MVDSRITPWPFSGAASKTCCHYPSVVLGRKLIVNPADVQRTVLDPKNHETTIM